MAAVIETRAPRRRHQDTSDSGLTSLIPGYVRNIALSFDLRQDPSAWEDPERVKTLWDVFPGTSEIGFTDNVLSFVVNVLPQKPWPLTVAGVPVYITTGYSCPDDIPPPRTVGRMVSNKDHPKVQGDHNGRNLDNWDGIFDIILGHFASLEIEITEVMYHANAVSVILKGNTADMARVPFSICQLACFYAFEFELGRGNFLGAPSQGIVPLPESTDSCVYETLRPGVMISSGYMPGSSQFWTTTAGVMVQDKNGDKFVTIAHHGFPSACGRQIMHPAPEDGDGRCIGRKAGRVNATDIALMELNDGKTFVNELFASEDFPQGKRLQKLVPAQHLPRYEILHMDTPETGAIVGTHLFTSRRCVPADDQNADTHHWLRGSWMYFVQNENRPLPNSIGGSAICDGDGNVVALFRLASTQGPTNGMCFAVGVDELVEEGYALC